MKLDDIGVHLSYINVHIKVHYHCCFRITMLQMQFPFLWLTDLNLILTREQFKHRINPPPRIKKCRKKNRGKLAKKNYGLFLRAVSQMLAYLWPKHI